MAPEATLRGEGTTTDQPATTPAATSRTRGSDRIWFAQLLRGVALVLVIYEHFVFGFWANNAGTAAFAYVPPLSDPNAGATHLSWFLPLVDHNILLGNTAVAMFFLISGFVIPMSLERYRPGRFLVARVFRLYPVWIVSLAVTAIALGIGAAVLGQPFPYSPTDWALNATLFLDWTFSPYIVPLVWTLLVEVKFYLLCTLLAWRFGLHRAAPIVVTMGALTLFTVLVQGRFEGLIESAFYGFVAIQIVASVTKFLCFTFLGLCFYNLFRGHWTPLKFTGVSAALFYLFFVSLEAAPDPDIFKRLLLWSFLIGYVVFAGSYLLRRFIPYSRTWNLVADVSYPLYAMHYILGVMLLTWLYGLHPLPLLNVLEASLLLFGLAYLVHRFVEVPGTRIGKRIRIDRAWLGRVGRVGRTREPRPAVVPVVASAGAPSVAGVDERPPEPAGPRSVGSG